MPALRNNRHELMAHETARGASHGEARATIYGKPDPQHAYKICTTDAFKARVAELRAPIIEATNIEIAHVLQKMIARAFYNPGDFYTTLDTGKQKFRPLDELTPDQLFAVDCSTFVGVDGTERHRFRLADRDKALDQLGRYLQMFKDTVVVENAFKVIQEMPDDELDRRIRELEGALAENEPWSNGPGELTRQ